MSQQPGRYDRSFGGLLGAMLVLVLVVGAFVAFRAVNRTSPDSSVRAVDYAGPADYARESASFDLVAPASLPDGWIATSVRYIPGDPDSWHLGLLTEQGKYVGLEQERAAVEDMVEEHVDPEAEQGDAVEVEGERWDAWSDAGGDQALVRDQDGTVTVLVGDVDPAVLRELATRLE